MALLRLTKAQSYGPMNEANNTVRACDKFFAMGKGDPVDELHAMAAELGGKIGYLIEQVIANGPTTYPKDTAFHTCVLEAACKAWLPIPAPFFEHLPFTSFDMLDAHLRWELDFEAHHIGGLTGQGGFFQHYVKHS